MDVYTQGEDAAATTNQGSLQKELTYDRINGHREYQEFSWHKDPLASVRHVTAMM
jgi:hypothetical protein